MKLQQTSAHSYRAFTAVNTLIFLWTARLFLLFAFPSKSEKMWLLSGSCPFHREPLCNFYKSAFYSTQVCTLILKIQKKKRKKPFRFQAILHFSVLMLPVLRSCLAGVIELHDIHGEWWQEDSAPKERMVILMSGMRYNPSSGSTSFSLVFCSPDNERERWLFSDHWFPISATSLLKVGDRWSPTLVPI